jgi:hypothetical protein
MHVPFARPTTALALAFAVVMLFAAVASAQPPSPDANCGCTAGTQPLYRLHDGGQSGAMRNAMVVQRSTSEGRRPPGAIARVALRPERN